MKRILLICVVMILTAVTLFYLNSKSEAHVDGEVTVPNELFLEGLSHYQVRDFPSALEKFSQSIQQEPTNSTAYHLRSVCYRETGNLDAAIKDIQTAIELDGSNEAYYSVLAAYLAEKGVLKEAIESATKSISLKPNSFAYYIRAEMHSRLGDIEVCIEDCKKGIDLKNDYVGCYEMLVNQLCRLNRNEEAVAFIENAVKSDIPNKEVLYYLAADACYMKEDYRRSIYYCCKSNMVSIYHVPTHFLYINAAKHVDGRDPLLFLEPAISEDIWLVFHPEFQKGVHKLAQASPDQSKQFLAIVGDVYIGSANEAYRYMEYDFAEDLLTTLFDFKDIYEIEIKNLNENYELRARCRIQADDNYGAISDCGVSYLQGNKTRFPVTLSLIAIKSIVINDLSCAQIRSLILKDMLSSAAI